MRRKILIIGVLVAAIPIALIGIALLYLNFADLSGYRSTVERLVSEALGRELRIAGEFQPDVGWTTRLVASDVSLANPPWASEPTAAAVDQLDVSLELVPLLFGRVRIPELVVDGARVFLETDAEGRLNWAFQTARPGQQPGKPPSIELGAVALRDVTVAYRAPSLARPLDLKVARLDVASDTAGQLTLQLDGELNGSTLALGGRIGPLGAIVSGGAIEHELEGRLGGVTMTTRGTIEELSTLAGANLTLEVHGPDADEVTETFGLPSLGHGAFGVTARLSPVARGTALSLSADLGQVTAKLDGEVDSLKALNKGVGTVSATGPDLAAAGSLIGADRLPAAPFTLAGRVAWDGFPVRIDNAEIRVGDNRVSTDGTLGAPPRLAGSDLRFEGSGPNLAAIGRLAALDLPRGEFSVRGRLARNEAGIDLDDVELRVAGATATVNGTLGDPPAFAGTQLAVRAAGPDLSAFSGLAGTALPEREFQLQGRVRPVDPGVLLEDFTTRVGEHRARIDGTIATAAGLVGTDLELEVEGPDLSWLAGLVGVTRAPAGAYSVDGRLNVRADGILLRSISARVGDASLAGGGRLGRLPRLIGTDMTFRIEGADASWPTALAGISRFPAEPFEAHGRIKVQESGYDLDGIEATVGEATVTASGRLGPIPNLSGTDLTLVAHIPDLASFDGVVARATLPGVEASVSGHVVVDASGVHLDGVTAEVYGTRITATGTIATKARGAGSDFEVELSSPDLAAAGRIVAGTGLVELPELPSEPLELTGHVAVDDDGIRVDGFHGTLGDATARFDGRIGRPPDFDGTDVTIDASGPDPSLVTAITGVSLPVAPFRVSGRLARLESGFRFDGLNAQLGEYTVRSDGTLGEPPRFEGTDLALEARGPSIALIQELAKSGELPDLPFRLEGRFDGNPQRFKSDRFSVRLGGSDVDGSFRIDLEGATPRFEAELGSRRIVLTEIIGPGEARSSEPESATSARPTSKGDGFVFSDRPIHLDAMNRVNGHVRWTADAADVLHGTLTDIELDARLDEGVLSIQPIRGVGAHGGRLDGEVVLAAGTAAHEVRTTIQLRGAHIDLTATEEDPAQWPTLDLDLQVEAAGLSLHDLASSANGRIVVTLGPGPVDDSLFDLVSADLVVQVLNLLNPFSGAEQTRLDCGIVAIEIDDGIATLDPFAMQTGRTTLVGDGTVDLETETLDLRWVTKPRKGIGISASTITNAYLKLGGTLAHPKIETKPLNALATTSVAVATGGLSLLGKGLFDRISAEKDICEEALKRIDRLPR